MTELHDRLAALSPAKRALLARLGASPPALPPMDGGLPFGLAFGLVRHGGGALLRHERGAAPVAVPWECGAARPTTSPLPALRDETETPGCPVVGAPAQPRRTRAAAFHKPSRRLLLLLSNPPPGTVSATRRASASSTRGIRRSRDRGPDPRTDPEEPVE